MNKMYTKLLIGVLFVLGSVSANAATITSALSGPWSSPVTWVGGVVPTSIDDVIIAATHIVDLDGSFACRSVNINATGTITATANTLTVGTAGGDNKTFIVGGTLTITGGTITHNGNMTISAGGTFNMSAGNLNIDGNGGTGATSVASGTSMMSILSNLGAVTGGTITIVDPHFAGTGKVIDYSTAATQLSWIGNTLILGGSSGTNTSTGTEGFHVDCFSSTGRLLLGHVTANGGSGANRITKTATSTANGTFIGGDLTINAGSEFRNEAATSFWVASNIINNGTYTGIGTLSLQTVLANAASPSLNAQTISGTGIFRNSVTSPSGNIAGLTVNNSNGTGVAFNVPTNFTVTGATLITTGIVAFNNTSVTFLGTFTNTAATSLPTFAGDVIFNTTYTGTNGTATFNGNATFNAAATVTAAPAAGGWVIATGKTITVNGATTLSTARAIVGAGNFTATSLSSITISGTSAGEAVQSGAATATIQNTGTRTFNNLTWTLGGAAGQSTGTGFPTLLPPGSTVTMSTVTSGTTLTQSTTFNNLTVTTFLLVPVGVVCTVGTTTAGILTLPNTAGCANIAGTLTVNFSTTLGTTATIIGTGTFNLGAVATLATANVGGISNVAATGSVQTTTKTFPATANYTFNGTAQSTGTALPTLLTAGTVTISPAGTGVALTQSTTFNNVTLTTSPFTAAVGITVAVNGIYTAASSVNLTGAGNFTANSGSTLVLGNISALGVLQIAAGAGNIQVTGTRTYAANVNITLAPSAVATGAGMPLSIGVLTLNNTAAAVLIQATTVSGLVILNTGNLTTTSFLLTVSSSSPSAVIRSGTGFVHGPMAWIFPVSFATAGAYLFPIGKTTFYQGFELINPVVNAGGSATLRMESFAVASGGTAGAGLNAGSLTARYWQATVTGAGLFTSVSNIRLTEIAWVATQKIGQSATLAGAYNSVGGAVGGITLTSTAALAAFGTGTFFAVGTGAGAGTFAAGNYAIGPSGPYGGYIATYTSITAAALDIANFASIGGNVFFEFQSDYVSTVEAYPIVVPNVGATTSARITFRPAAGVGSVINFNPAGGLAGTPILDMNGAMWTTFDGRPGGAGSNRFLRFNNLGQGPALRLINDAQNNTLTYLDLRSSLISQTSGIVLISTTAVGAALANGNNNNTISFNNINGAGISPIGIYALGTVAPADNKSNTITDNNIFDYFSDNATANWRNVGVWVSGNNAVSASSTWTISNNSFYQTATRTIVLGITAASPSFLQGLNIDASSGTFNITGNYIGGSAPLCAGGAWTQTGAGNSSNAFVGMRLFFGTVAASSVSGNFVQNISVSSATTSGFNTGINVGSGTASVTTNTIGSLAAAANISYTSTGGAGSVFGGMNMSNVAAAATLTINSNNIGGIAVSGTVPVSLRGITINSASIFAGAQTINSNTIGSSSGPLTNSTNAQILGINQLATTAGIVFTMAGNTISYLTHTNTGLLGQIFGISVGASGTVSVIGTSALPNNINNLSSSTSFSTAVGGILSTNTTAGQTFSNNIIHTLQATGSVSTAVLGIGYGGPTTGTNLISRNLVHSFSNTVTGTHIGILVQTVSTVATVQNNMVRLGINPNGSSQTIPNSIAGISKTATGSMNVYFNSVYIGGSGVTNSGNSTSAFVRSGTPASADDIRNNIFVNVRSNSSSGGSHFAINITSNTFITSNYNDLYVTGSGGQIGYAATSDFTTFASWKAGTGLDATSVNGDPQYIAPTGTSATVDLHIHPTNPTQIEATGILIGSVVDDYDGQTRSTLSPTDMGADAGNFVVQDVTAPVISSINYVGTACNLVSRNVTATITDLTGVDNAGFQPRIYFRKNAGAYFSAAGALTAGSVTNGTWTFTITYATVGGVIPTDVIDYYIVAQDVAVPFNVGGNPSTGLVLTDVNTIITPPTTPLTYTIGTVLAAGTYTVGTTAVYDYPNLTAAVADYNTRCLGGAIVFKLMDPTYTTLTGGGGPSNAVGEIFPITINNNPDASSSNTLTIRPETGVAVVMTNLAASVAVIKMLNARFVTIDGLNTGGSSLTLTNANTTTASAGVWLASTVAAGPGCNNIAVQNLTINGGSNTITTCFGIVACVDGAAPSTTGGLDNDNITIQGNTILKSYYGIFANGTASVSAGGMDVLNINTNIVGPVVGGVDNIGFSGINIGNAVAPSVTQNTVQNIAATVTGATGIQTAVTVAGALISQNTIQNLTTTSPKLYGIFLNGTGGTYTVSRNIITGLTCGSTTFDYIVGIETIVAGGSTIERNNISTISNNHTGTYGAYGINLNGGSGHIVKNNFVSGVTGVMTGGGAFSTTFGIFGIRIGTGSSHLIYHNSVNLFGLRPGVATSSLLGAAFCMVSTGSLTCDVRNNIFTNTMTGGTTSIAYPSMYLPTGGGAGMGLILNNNAYYTGATAGVHGINQGGTSYVFPVVSSGIGLFTVANFIPTATSPVTNLRSYTSLLGTATNDNASMAFATAAPFTTDNNLHLLAAGSVLKAGTPIGSVTTDFDNDPRNLIVPAMGADEILVNGFWTGTVSTVWDGAVTGNWDDGAIPIGGANIVVPAGVTNSPVLTGISPSIGNLNLGAGKTLSINGNSPAISGAITGTGTITGSSTSNLTMGGVTTLNMTQTNASTRSLSNLTVQGASANVTLGNALDIYGLVQPFIAGATLNMAGQAVTLKSTATATARVANLTGVTISAATNVTVERYINSDVVGRKWHLLSGKSTVSSQTIRQSWQENGVVAAGLGTWITSTTYDGLNGYDATNNNLSSIFTHDAYDAPTWRTPAATNTGSINDSSGYMIFVRGDRFATAANALTAPTVLRTNGSLRMGLQAGVTILNIQPAYTLLGNPYASPVDFETIFLGTTNLSPFFTVWDASFAGTYGVGGYRTVERTGPGTYTATPTTGSDNTLRYLHSGQALFVRTDGVGNAIIAFDESYKTSSLSVVNPIVATGNGQQIYTSLMVMTNGNTENLADAVRVKFNADYTAATTDDAPKIGNFTQNISSYRNNRKWIVELRPMIVNTDTIFLFMSNMTANNYRFKVSTIDFVQSNVSAWLQDAFTGQNTPLDLSGNTLDINFSVTADPASANNNRFRIVFKANGPLPSTITSVKAAQQGSNIAVEWKASNQYNMQKYEVEKSTDGVNFTMVNTQAAVGTNGSDATYNWLDVNPVTGNNHYRIRSIGISGDIKVTQVVTVKISKGNPAITVYPNPVINRTIGVQFTDMEKGIYKLRLVNTMGQVVYTKSVNHTGGSATETMVFGYAMAKGTYRLEITKPDGLKTTKTILIAD